MEMNIEKNISGIRRDPHLRNGDKIVICVNKERPSMLENALLLTAEGALRQMIGDPITGGKSDGAEVRLTEGGEALVTFHETRTNSLNRRPNGILVSTREFPCVVFCNTGSQRLTVGVEHEKNSSVWVAPGGYTFMQDRDMNDPEVQDALRALIQSPEIEEEVEDLRRQMEEEKEGGEV